MRAIEVYRHPELDHIINDDGRKVLADTSPELRATWQDLRRQQAEARKDPAVLAELHRRQARIAAACNEGGEGYGSPLNDRGQADNTPRYKGDDQAEIGREGL